MGYVHITPAKLAAANRYSNLLRTRPERIYASAYITWLRNGGEGLEPERGKLSRAAAQAIRLHLDSLNMWGE